MKIIKIFAGIIAAITLTAVLYAFDISIGAKKAYGGLGNIVVPDSGLGNITVGGLPTPGTTMSAGNDAVSINALIGNWGRVNSLGRRDLPYWVFGADGRFATYTAETGKSGYTTTYYERWVQGKYRVNGNTIEFYDCMVCSNYHIGGGWKYYKEIPGSPYELPANTLLDTPLPAPEKKDNYFAMFEFESTMRLRLVTENDVLNYDSDFAYHGDSHNVEIPAHIIPSKPWPKGELPADVLEFSDGRIREIYTDRGELYIVIYRTTREAYCDYVERHFQAGWKGDSSMSAEYIANFRQGKYESHVDYTKKSSYIFKVSMKINGTVELVLF